MHDFSAPRWSFIGNVVYLLLLAGIVYIACHYLLKWLLPMILGGLIVLAVQPLARWISRRTGLKERASRCVALVVFYLGLTLLLIYLGMAVIAQVQLMLAEFPSWVEQSLHPSLEKIEHAVRNILTRIYPAAAGRFSLRTALPWLQDQVLSMSTDIIGRLGAVTAELPDMLMTFLFTILCSVAMSWQYRAVCDFVKRQLPVRHHSSILTLSQQAANAVLRSARNWLTLVLATFVLMAAGLWLLRVERFLPFAICVAILDLIPSVGPGLVLLPWSLLALLQGNGAMALGLLLLYLLMVATHNILELRLMGAQPGVNSLVSICALYGGYRIMGVMGMILAPIAVQLLVELHRTGAVRLWK